MLGSPDDRFDSWGVRIKEVLVGWLGQKRVLRDRVAGTMHVLMFWGFLMLGATCLILLVRILFRKLAPFNTQESVEWYGGIRLYYCFDRCCSRID